MQEEEDIREGRGKKASSGIVPIILAAGESRRFGSPKSLVKFGKKYLISRTIENCAKAGLSPIVVLGSKADIISRKASLSSYIVNKDWRKGQLSSLLCGLKMLPKDARAFLIYPVDYPLVTYKEIRKLISVSKYYRKYKIVRASYKGQAGHPVLIDASLKREFIRLGPLDTARDVLGKDPKRAKFVNMNSDSCIRNMNTRKDYFSILRQYFKA